MPSSLVHGAPMVQRRSHKRINAGRCSDLCMVFKSCAHKPFESMGEERIRKFHINVFFIFFIFMMSLKWLSSTRQQDMKVKKFKHHIFGYALEPSTEA